MLNLHQQTIRSYEKMGLISPKRSEGNTRMFTEEDITTLETVIYYTNKLGVNLSGVEVILKMQKEIDKMQKKMNTLFSQSKDELSKEMHVLEEEIIETKEALEKVQKNKKRYKSNEGVLHIREKNKKK